MKNGRGMQGRMAVMMAAMVVIFTLCGCVQQLNDLQNSLSKVSKTLSGKHGGAPTARGGMAAMPEMSPPQRQLLQSQLSGRIPDRTIHQAREEARPVLEKILTISACYPQWDIHRYLTPYSSGQRNDHSAPMVFMTYHPKSECLSVTRVDNWRMRARNAFSFRAVFVSDSSAESADRHYEMIKDPDGAWLLR